MKPNISLRAQSSLERLENRIAPAGLLFTATRGIVNVLLDGGTDGTYDILADSFSPFINYRGGINIATADMDGDGNSELITAKASGTPSIKIWAVTGGGHVGPLLDTITPALGNARGASVAAADLNNDGRDEIVIGSGPGFPPVVLTARDSDRDGLFSDETFDSIAPFAANFRGGVKVAAGNTNNTGGEEVIVAMGRAGGKVAVFSDVNSNAILSDDVAGKLEEFTPFGAKFRGGINVASGPISGAGTGGADIVVVKATGKPSVLIFTDSNASGTVSDDALFDTIPLTGPGYVSGANVGAGDTDDSGILVEVITAPAHGKASIIKILDDDGDLGALLSDNDPDDVRPAFASPAAGVTVAFGKVISESFSFPDGPIGLPDAATTTLRFSVPSGAGLIRDLDVGLAIAHTYDPDLDVTITHNGVSVVLFTDVPAASADGFIIRLSDEAINDIGAATGVSGSALTGTFDPEGAAVLSTFDGLDASGEWTLTIVDDAAGDSGTLFNWTLFVTT